jgi:serine/threonine protein kinase
MNEFVARETNETAFLMELNWQRRLDALVCGTCSEDDFIAELSALREVDPDSAWNVVALLDQRYRRGQMPDDLFRSIERKIAKRDLDTFDYGTTITLDLPTERHVPWNVVTVPAPDDHLPIASAPQTTPLSPADRVNGRSASPAPEIGRVLRDRYVLESRLGSGGMGTVFKAMDRYRCDLPEGNRRIAIKFLHEETDSRPEGLPSLRREFYCAQALSHRSIVKVYELDRDEGLEFFTMELLEGELLSGVLGRLPIRRPDAWAIILEVGAGLAHAHARNVVHGDLKPQNIMITNSGELRILDFGASRTPAGERSSADEAQRGTPTKLTPAYACCELLEGQQADPRDDIYALACVAYELLAAEHPFQYRRSTEARALGMIARRPPGLSKRQWQTLAMGLSWSREGRSIAVDEWIARLSPRPAAVAQLVPPQDLNTERLPQQAAAPPSRAIALAAIVVVCLIGVAMWVSFAPSLEWNLAGHADTVEAQGTPPINAEPTADRGRDSSPEEPLAGSVSTAPSPPISQPAAFSATVRNDASRVDSHKDKVNKISISADTYRIRPRDNFAEIRVRRSSEAGGDTSFVWWTEPSSAQPGSDYVPQARVTQILPKGRHMTSLFIKIIPNASRKHPAVFYVAIGDPSNGAALGRVARTAILLPPSG